MVGSEAISKEDKEALSDLILNKKGEKEDEQLKRAKEFLDRYPEVLKQAEENLKFLKDRKEIDPEYFVSVLATQEELDSLLKTSNQLFLQEFVLTSNRPEEVAEVWRKILLLRIGAPFYLRASSPDLFGPEELTPIDVTAKNETKNAKPPAAAAAAPSEPAAPEESNPSFELEDLRKKADQATQKILRSLHDNPQTLRKFRPFIPLIRPGSKFVQGKSDAQIHAYIMKRTWKPARAETEAWLNAQLRYIHATQSPQKKARTTKGASPELTSRPPVQSQSQPEQQQQQQQQLPPSGLPHPLPKPQPPAPEEPKTPPTQTSLNAAAKGLFSQVVRPEMNGVLFLKKAYLTPFSTALNQGCLLSQPR